MTRSRSIAIAFTPKQLAYVRELVTYDRGIGHELPPEDDFFDSKNKMADSVLKSLDAPMPLYELENSNV
jgi:hypothetical protein